MITAGALASPSLRGPESDNDGMVAMAILLVGHRISTFAGGCPSNRGAAASARSGAHVATTRHGAETATTNGNQLGIPY